MKTVYLLVNLLLGMALTVSALACSSSDEENVGGGETTNGAINDHQYVDLGLSVKWATCNWGASQSGPGMYNRGTYYKYDNTNYREFDSYDVVTAEWGSPWRRPTAEEIRELIQKCKWDFDPYLGGNGCAIVTGPNGNKLYLPFAGYISRERSSYDDRISAAYKLSVGEVSNVDSRSSKLREIKEAHDVENKSIFPYYDYDGTCYMLIDNGIETRNENGIVRKYVMSEDEAHVYRVSAASGYIDLENYIRPVAPY